MKNIEQAICDIKAQKPLILNLTNFVTMDFVANCLLAIGAAPIMCTSEDELEELVKISSVIYINIGTLNADFISLIKKASDLAIKHNKPIVLDPVGAGATKLRTSISSEIASCSKIIRGNASEIMALGNHGFLAKGVEAVHKTEDATGVADNIAITTKSAVVISGAIDYVTDGMNSERSKFGSPLMTNVTGMGCSLTAIIAAVLAVTKNPFEAGVIGAQYFSLCGEIAAQNHKKPGSFKAAFIDELYHTDFDLMRGLYEA